MDDSLSGSNAARDGRAKRAEALFSQMFSAAGWQVRPQPAGAAGGRADFMVRRGKVAYVAEIKAASEGRSDRLIPLWSQAHLEARRAAGERHPSLAVVAAPRISPRVAEQILNFASEYAPDGAAGVMDFEGLRRFQGPSLEAFDALPAVPAIGAPVREQPVVDLFSDLNQWLLKILLAPELPDRLLSAPRGRYRNASQLARAANVSVMSAFRFVRRLQQEGFAHESAPYLDLVRREELFKRWQASSAAPVSDLPMRFLLRRDPQSELRRMFEGGRACLGLYAAADALGYGFVKGVPPHVYVQRFRPSRIAAWKNLVPAGGDRPDLILRQPPAPQSIFRGMVRREGAVASDILQVWLDVAAHEARGQEQADLIERKVLAPIIKGGPRG